MGFPEEAEDEPVARHGVSNPRLGEEVAVERAEHARHDRERDGDGRCAEDPATDRDADDDRCSAEEPDDAPEILRLWMNGRSRRWLHPAKRCNDSLVLSNAAPQSPQLLPSPLHRVAARCRPARSLNAAEEAALVPA